MRPSSSQLGETKLDVKPGYEKDLVKFIASSRATLQAIINDEFLPAKAWNGNLGSSRSPSFGANPGLQSSFSPAAPIETSSPR